MPNPVSINSSNTLNKTSPLRSLQSVILKVGKCALLVLFLPVTLILLALRFKPAIACWISPTSASTTAQGTDNTGQSGVQGGSRRSSVLSEKETHDIFESLIEKNNRFVEEHNPTLKGDVVNIIQFKEYMKNNCPHLFINLCKCFDTEYLENKDRNLFYVITFCVVDILTSFEKEKIELDQNHFEQMLEKLNSALNRRDVKNYAEICLKTMFDLFFETCNFSMLFKECARTVNIEDMDQRAIDAEDVANYISSLSQEEAKQIKLRIVLDALFLPGDLCTALYYLISLKELGTLLDVASAEGIPGITHQNIFKKYFGMNHFGEYMCAIEDDVKKILLHKGNAQQ